MKDSIHPSYGPATISCGCGNSWETRSTKQEMRVELCNVCHPFFTGEQRIVDTAGRVERFRRRYGIEEEQTGTAKANSEASATEVEPVKATVDQLEPASE